MPRRTITTVALLLASTLNAQNKTPTPPQEFHGTYEELSPAQRKLIDEWYAEYNQFSLSTRTTFEAVTHALMTTPLNTNLKILVAAGGLEPPTYGL